MPQLQSLYIKRYFLPPAGQAASAHSIGALTNLTELDQGGQCHACHMSTRLRLRSTSLSAASWPALRHLRLHLFSVADAKVILQAAEALPARQQLTISERWGRSASDSDRKDLSRLAEGAGLRFAWDRDWDKRWWVSAWSWAAAAKVSGGCRMAGVRCRIMLRCGLWGCTNPWVGCGNPPGGTAVKCVSSHS